MRASSAPCCDLIEFRGNVTSIRNCPIIVNIESAAEWPVVRLPKLGARRVRGRSRVGEPEESDLADRPGAATFGAVWLEGGAARQVGGQLPPTTRSLGSWRIYCDKLIRPKPPLGPPRSVGLSRRPARRSIVFGEWRRVCAARRPIQRVPAPPSPNHAAPRLDGGAGGCTISLKIITSRASSSARISWSGQHRSSVVIDRRIRVGSERIGTSGSGASWIAD